MTRAFRTLGYLGISTGMVLLAFGLVLIPQNTALADEGDDGSQAGCYITVSGQCDSASCPAVPFPSQSACAAVLVCKPIAPNPPVWDCTTCTCKFKMVLGAGRCTCDP